MFCVTTVNRELIISLTRTGPGNHWRRLEAWNFGFIQKRKCTIQVAKTKSLISVGDTAKLICVFVFRIYKYPVFSRRGSYFTMIVYEPLHEKNKRFCICEYKDEDQLRGNRKAEQRLCFRFLESTIPLLHKYKISSLYPPPVALQPGLCET